MTTHHSTRPPKPAKPYPDFPLFPHATGRWAKKIRGRMHYFGKWDDPHAALERYMADKDALHAGKEPREEVSGAGVTVKALCNRFMQAKADAQASGEITARHWHDCMNTCRLLIDRLGKHRLWSDIDPADFERLRKHIADTRGPIALGNVVQRVRSVFKYAYDIGLIPAPLRFGPNFKRPAKKVLRKARTAAGPRMFQADELRRIIDAATQPLRAMILLGINCGFGNSDVGQLPLAALDLENGWATYPRPKTGVERRCSLWPETVAAIREALEHMPKAKRKEDAGLVFVTKYGGAWFKDELRTVNGKPKATIDNPVSKATAKLLKSLDINGHRGFYTLRHTFRTVADEARDQPACDFIMGHESTHMSSHIRERISDERLKTVAEHVRGWAFSADDLKTTNATLTLAGRK